MAVTLASDLKVYEPEAQSGLYEGVAQFISGVVEASKGAITMKSSILPGHFYKEALFDLVFAAARRDITTTSGITPTALTQDNTVSVKLNRQSNVVGVSLDSLKKAGKSWEEIVYVAAKQYAEVKMQDMLNSGLIAVESAIEAGSTASNYDATSASPKTLITTDLVEALAKFGDRAGDIVAWVMHSKPFYDLVKSQEPDQIYNNDSGLTIYGGAPASYGRPIIVTDSPALTDANGSATDTYNVLGLTRGALTIDESEEESFVIGETVVAVHNMYRPIKGEYAYNVGVRGMRWKVATGANPADATLGTTSNWERAVTSIKYTAGVRIKVE